MTSRKRLFADAAARWLVTGGGMLIIASILAILLFIVIEVWPLVRGARVEPGPTLTVSGASVPAVLTDEYRSHVAALGSDARLSVQRVDTGRVVLERHLLDSDAPAALPLDRPGVAPGQQLFTAMTADGRGLAVPLEWPVTFDEDRRVVTPVTGDPVLFPLDPQGVGVGAFSLRVDDDGTGIGVAGLADGTLVVAVRSVEENMLTGERSESWERFEHALPAGVTQLLLAGDGGALYGATADGSLIWWPIRGGVLEAPQRVAGSTVPVSTLSLLIGDRSLVVGRDDGALEIWFPVRQPDESWRFTRIRRLPGMDAAVRAIAPSLRDKGFVALDEQGGVGLYYSTSARRLWTGRAPVADARALFFAPRGDGVLLAGAGSVGLLAVDNPHPEISLTALFGKIWYEGYERPEYVWQSSSGTDDFEPKLSMTPLIVGTLKGTLYSLVLAIPLGVLGAMYTSQFMAPGLKRMVKPTVEIMAALPSVVLGFLAGLWLAPRVEQIFPALVLMMLALPPLVLAAGFGWRAVPPRLRGRLPAGSEALLHVVVLAVGIWLCLQLNGAVEATVFGGSFQQWLLNATGLQYDQRNAIVVGLAMGFAVIPIIFSIAEDAFSNVPRNLVSGSLALGANRWQTVTRVVLPTASPGIFSAIMIGFGRAVGETMIVLMATGNTPVMDWNPFNGLRTLSANIAVEIPEAPHGGTLYRALFLAALILFGFTFLINTVAELVRQRLRKRYSEL